MSDASPSTGRIALLSLGCAKNLVDSERLVGHLQAAGFQLAEDLEDADLALVNTCGFIDPAKEESVETILRVAGQKEYGRLRGLMVAGCLVERYRADLEREMPEVDRWLSFADYPRIADEARSLMGLPQVPLQPQQRVLLTPAAYAYLKISEGCDQRCSFCAIPAIRGRLQSRSIEDNVADARHIAARGVGEINVVSQDTTAYGRDLYGRPRLVELVRALTEVQGPRWWRLLYLYPSIVQDDLLEEIAGNERVAAYIDVPLQHVSDRVLRAMRRGISARRQRQLLERIRRIVPGAAIRTTLITGFPGETEQDHREMLAFVREGWFDRLGVFTFSREEGTPSHDLPGAVEPARMEARRGELMAAQQEVHTARNLEKVGRTLEVLIETVDRVAGEATGRTEHDAPEVDGIVRVRGIEDARPGAVVEVRVTAADDYDLVAEPLRARSGG